MRSLQECLGDDCAAVAALALQSIALLCQDDVLEFYAAWRVVQTALPKLPSQVGPQPFSQCCDWCPRPLPPPGRTHLVSL